MKMKLTLAMAAIALALPLLAHPGGHDDEQVREKSIPEKAEDAVMREITRAKLDASWRGAAAGKPALRTVKGVKQWVVPFAKKAGNGKAGTLYVTLTEAGDFVRTSASPR
ncbi:MAG: DUF6488 family protein [Sphingomonadaceae bacterium]|jgi:hypothetical protein|nr:DUF6488 family protein [Sphingomonadaceae bacterium]